MHPGRVIKLLRESEGLSQQTLADSLNVARPYLSQLENEKSEPSIALLKKAAKIFNIPIALMLLEGSDEHVAVMSQLQRILADVLEAKRKIQDDKKKSQAKGSASA